MGVKDSANAIYQVEPNSSLAREDAVPRGYKRTEVGVIPEDWIVVCLSEIAEPLIGLTYRPSDVALDGTLVLRSSNIQDDSLRFDDTVYVTCSVPPKIMCRRGDILICVRNGSRDLIGKCALISEMDCPTTFGAFMAVLRTPQHNFVFWQFKSSSVQTQIREHLGATINQITNASLNSFLVLQPPTEVEQETIAEALGDADALIESLQQLIAKKRAIKQGAMQALLTGRQRLPGFTEEWQTKRLENLGAFRKGQGVSRGDSQSGTLPCVRYGEIYTTHNNFIRTFASWISEAVAKSATRINEGDILFAGSGETKAEIGKCVVVNQDIVAYAGGDIVIFHLYEGDPLFYGYALNTPDVNRQKASRGQGDAVVHISSAVLATIEVAVPGVEEQTAIAAVLSDMDAEIEALEARLAKTRALKAGMMQALLTGRIRLV